MTQIVSKYGDDIVEKKVENFKKEIDNDPTLKKYHKTLVDERIYFVLKAAIAIFIILTIFATLWLIQTGKFQSDISCNQNVTIPSCPIIPSCPSCPVILIPSCPAYPGCNLNCGN